MLWMLVILFLALVAAAAVVVYVVYPHRDEEVPYVPWVGEAMRKSVDSLPTVDNLEQRDSSRS